MILYHYSVDSYKGGSALINDYKKQYQYAEPFILALRQNMEIFSATYYAAMYMSRELVALKLRKYENYCKDAVEAIFEFVRETEFSTLPSRLNCVYYCETKEEALSFMEDDCLADGLFSEDQVKLLEVDVEDDRVQIYDQNFYNYAMNEMEHCDFESVFAFARKYYSLERTAEPLLEIVSDGQNRIIGEIVCTEIG